MQPDEKKILSWAGSRKGPITLHVSATNHEKSTVIEEFAERIARISGIIKVKSSKDPTGLPCIKAGNIRFSMIPDGLKLDGFLKLLEKNHQEQEKAGAQRRITLFIAPNCPVCPVMYDRVIDLAIKEPSLETEIIDAFMFPEEAENFSVKTVPSLFSEKNLLLTGEVSYEKLRSIIEEQDTGQPGIETVKSMLHSQQAEAVAGLMIKKGIIFDALFDLLKSPKWPDRLGAMVVFEYIAEDAPALAKSALPLLISLFHSSDRTVQGDLIYLVGKIADSAALSFLQQLQEKDLDEEIKEAVREALEGTF